MWLIFLLLLVLVYFWITTQTVVIQPIPKCIYQTYNQFIPEKVALNFQKYASDFERKIYDDTAARQVLTDHFPLPVVATFDALSGAHRADLVRYCLLYLYGGVYLDIKTELTTRLTPFLSKHRANLFVVLNYQKNHIYNGVIAARPRHPIFLELIDYIVKIGPPPFYHQFCHHFLQTLTKYTGKAVVAGENPKAVYTTQEVCSSNPTDCYDGLDRHGLCCHIFDGEQKVFKTRYSDFGRTW